MIFLIGLALVVLVLCAAVHKRTCRTVDRSPALQLVMARTLLIGTLMMGGSLLWAIARLAVRFLP